MKNVFALCVLITVLSACAANKQPATPTVNKPSTEVVAGGVSGGIETQGINGAAGTISAGGSRSYGSEGSNTSDLPLLNGGSNGVAGFGEEGGRGSRGTGLVGAAGSAGSSVTADGLFVPSSLSNIIYFGYDSADIGTDGLAVIQSRAQALQGATKVRVEGHADERGSAEYNLALGERRAQSVAKRLQALGLSNVEINSYGSEKPADDRHTEEAWAKNRRVEITP